jgi:acetyl-CoA acetyltransferase family protein
MATLLAGLPVDVAAGTVNRLCGSGLMAINQACDAIRGGSGEVFIAGGVESMTRAPFVMGKPDSAFSRGEQKLFDSTLGWRFVNDRLSDLYHPYSMGETAENVAEKFKIERAAQDQFALESQQKYKAAQDAGKFRDEIVGVPLPSKKKGAEPVNFLIDEHPRAETTLADLQKLKPAFRKEGGTVTAGNSSGINDGASAVLMMSKDRADRLKLKPMAKIVSHAVAGVEPALMGIGPVPASRKALERAGLKVSDLDLIELNEAFAAQSLACISELGLDSTKVNVNGGAIAIGHPLGCSGSRIITTLVHEMRRRQAKLGLATMCIGVGQGIATIISLDI